MLPDRIICNLSASSEPTMLSKARIYPPPTSSCGQLHMDPSAVGRKLAPELSDWTRLSRVAIMPRVVAMDRRLLRGGAVSPDVDRFYRTLVREAPDAIIYADAGGLVVFWTDAAERIFGFSEAEAVGKSLDIIIPETLRQRHWDGYAATMRTGKTRYGAGDVLAVPALRKGGARISIEFTIVPFADRTGRILGIAAILRDVTKQFEEMKALRKELATYRTAARPAAATPGLLP